MFEWWEESFTFIGTLELFHFCTHICIINVQLKSMMFLKVQTLLDTSSNRSASFSTQLHVRINFWTSNYCQLNRGDDNSNVQSITTQDSVLQLPAIKSGSISEKNQYIVWKMLLQDVGWWTWKLGEAAVVQYMKCLNHFTKATYDCVIAVTPHPEYRLFTKQSGRDVLQLIWNIKA